jgi:hypothetical protein
MSARTLIEMQNPVTQSLDAIKTFLTWKGRALDPMPSTIEFMQEGDGRMVLFLSNKKNSYYVVTSTKCSCPSQTYRGGACKHMRKHFGAKAEAEQSTDSIMQDGQWPHGEHGPVPEILGGGGLVPQDKPEEEARPMSDEELEKECASKGLRCPD